MAGGPVSNIDAIQTVSQVGGAGVVRSNVVALDGAAAGAAHEDAGPAIAGDNVARAARGTAHGRPAGVIEVDTGAQIAQGHAAGRIRADVVAFEHGAGRAGSDVNPDAVKAVDGQGADGDVGSLDFQPVR